MKRCPLFSSLMGEGFRVGETEYFNRLRRLARIYSTFHTGETSLAPTYSNPFAENYAK